MTTEYLGTLDDNTIIRSTSLERIAFTPNLKYLFKFEIMDRVKWNFLPINKDGSFATIKVGNFELIHIGDMTKDYERLVTVRDIKQNVNRQQKFGKVEHYFISDELLPFLKDLEVADSWDSYKLSKGESD